MLLILFFSLNYHNSIFMPLVYLIKLLACNLYYLSKYAYFSTVYSSKILEQSHRNIKQTNRKIQEFVKFM